MNVLVTLASSAAQLSGVQRHGINLVRALLTHREIQRVHLIVAPWQIDFVRDAAPWADERLCIHAAKVGRNAFARNRWYFWELPKLTRRVQADVVHLAYPVPLHIQSFDCPVVVTLHDLYPYDVAENFGFPKVFLNRLVLKQCMRSADAIACVSASTLGRLERVHPLLALAKASVLPNCVERYEGRVMQNNLISWGGDPFLLCVAQHRRNKNIFLLLRAFASLVQSRAIPPRMRLVIVGGRGPETSSILRFLHSSCCASRVLLLEGLSDAELHWCYRHCELLVAPSIVEGFGLPVAEALLTGCRVLCSDIESLREIGGEHCRYVALQGNDQTRLALALEQALSDRHPRPIELPQLSAATLGQQCVQLYARLLTRATNRNACILSPSMQNGERKSVA